MKMTLWRSGLGMMWLIWWTGAMPAFSQTITISEDIQLRSDYSFTVLGWIDDDLLMFRDKGHEFSVEALDEDLHIKWERNLNLGGRRVDVIGLIPEEDRFNVLYGIREKGSYYLYHQSFAHDLSPIDTALIDTIDNIFLTPQIRMEESEDHRRVVFYHDEAGTLMLTGYDLDARARIWKNTIRLTGSNLERDFSSLIVNNRGQFFLTMAPDKFFQKPQNLELFYNLPGQSTVQTESMFLQSTNVDDYYTTYDNLHDVFVITGLYSERGSTRSQGFYFVRFRPGENPSMQQLPFDESLLENVYGREVASSKGLSDFTIQQVALRHDGGAVIIAEMNKEFSRRSSLPLRRDNGSFSRSGWVDYYYEDMILMTLFPDGEEHWKAVLRKRQYSQDDEAKYSSFFLFKTPEKLRFLFNDEIKQENTVGSYEVSGTGHVERKTVFNTDYQRLKLRFRDGLQVSANECIVPSERNTKLNLVRIVYDD